MKGDSEMEERVRDMVIEINNRSGIGATNYPSELYAMTVKETLEIVQSEVALSWQWVKYDPEHPPEEGEYVVAQKKNYTEHHIFTMDYSLIGWESHAICYYIPHKLPEVK